MKLTAVSPDSRRYPRTVSLSIGTWNAIDSATEHGERSSFVEQAVVEFLAKLSQEKAK